MIVEKKILDHLNKNLDVNAYAERIESLTGSFIIIEKTASSEINKVKSATVAVQSYAPSLLEAAELNEEVKNCMYKLANDKDIGSVKLNSDYSFNDTRTKEYRYQAVFNITYI